MKTKFFAGLAVALLFAGPAFAHDGRGGGGGGGGRVATFSGGGGTRGFAFSRGSGGSFRSPSVAFGGGSTSSRAFARGRGGGNYTYAFRSHSGWNPGSEYAWGGHHYRWYNNAWFIVDPYPYYADDPYYDDYGPAYTVYGQSDTDSDSAGVPVQAQVQQELAREGYYRGPIDGLVGPATRAAISAYQQDNGLRVTGTINGHLLDALDLD